MVEFGRILLGFWTKGQPAHYPLPVILVGDAGGVNAGDTVVEAIRDLLPGGADHVFDFVGLKSVAEQGLSMLGVGSGLYLVGLAAPDIEIRVSLRSLGEPIRTAAKLSNGRIGLGSKAE
jgi:Zn-dependent alcohol dehydrogenase